VTVHPRAAAIPAGVDSQLGRGAAATACPLCGSRDARTLRSYSADEAAQHFALAEQEPARHAELSAVIAQLWGAQRAASRECSACGLGFADPFVAGNGEFYTLAFGASGYPKDKWEFRKTLVELARHDCRGWNVLEIGAGGGYFLDLLAKVGIPANQRFGSEYNQVTLARMHAKGYQVKPLEIDELASFGKAFDAICMFQVLEHRDRIEDTFRTIHSLLREGGHLFLAVPNAERIRFNEANGSLFDMPPNHISQWSIENFRLAAERFGYRLVEAQVEPSDAKSFVRQDMIFSFMRKAQQRGTLANRIYPRRKSPIGRAAVAAAVGLNAVTRVPLWVRRRRELTTMGDSIWVHMQRA
jgi:2-polyprenyl-3-methyl-5-hydroxy-6-metoxy-1,4-benzoquinol methylase